MKNLKLKVCGLRNAQNLQKLIELPLNYVGFIFYEKSPRIVVNHLHADDLPSFPENIQKVGIFVNESIDKVFSQVNRYELDLIQLHGDESADYCASIKSPILRGSRGISNHVKTIKAFGIDDNFDFDILQEYEPHCDYYLFDTKGKDYGGNGTAFNWEVLKKYKGNKTFFLSGGIGLENVDALLTFLKENSLPVHALDINSALEDSPGIKNIEKVKEICEKLSI